MKNVKLTQEDFLTQPEEDIFDDQYQFEYEDALSQQQERELIERLDKEYSNYIPTQNPNFWEDDEDDNGMVLQAGE